MPRPTKINTQLTAMHQRANDEPELQPAQRVQQATARKPPLKTDTPP